MEYSVRSRLVSAIVCVLESTAHDDIQFFRLYKVEVMSCCSRAKKDPLCDHSLILDELELSPLQKNILKERYIKLVYNTKERTRNISFFFHISRTIVTVGSIITPALLSIQYTDLGTAVTSESFTFQIYWATWIVSLLVSVCNGLMTLFKIDKKFLYLHTNLEHLISEGWQYAELSGRYSGFYTPKIKPTHNNQFIFFCHTIEKIRMREIEEEYNRLHEMNHTPPAKNQILPITPMNPRGDTPPKEEDEEEQQQRPSTQTQQEETKQEVDGVASTGRKVQVSVTV